MKLVRDHVPGLDVARLRPASPLDHRRLFEATIAEEYAELVAAGTDEERTEELADLLQIVYDLAAWHGVRIEHAMVERQKKLLSHGGFRQMLVLDQDEEITE